MSLEDFQLLDNEPTDDSIIKRNYSKIYHQQVALLNDPDQNVELIFGESSNYHQVGNSHLGFNITVPKAKGKNFNFTNDPATNEVIGLVNNAFAYCFKEGTISTTGGMKIEQVKFLGQVSTIMRALTSKDGDLSSHFDNVGETQNGSNNTSLYQMLFNNHTEANRGKIKGHLPLKHKFGLINFLERLLKTLVFI